MFARCCAAGAHPSAKAPRSIRQLAEHPKLNHSFPICITLTHVNDDVGAGKRLRGRPRSERARTAILDAAAELLLAPDGDAVSMDAVAERAGVSKATIYRWWRSRETLTLDALYDEWASARPVRDTGSLREDLLSLLRPWVRRVGRRSYGPVIARLITEAQTDRRFGEEWRSRFIGPRRDAGREVFARAIRRGEIPGDTNVEVALDLLYGPLYHRLLHRHAPLNDRFVHQVVDTALGGIASGSVAGRNRGNSRGQAPL
jgi:AcrR family transcriptional regulator